MPNPTADSKRLDRAAVVLSALCLLHCLSIPVLLALAPAVSSLLLGTETTVHWIFLAVAVPVSVWALARGYRRSRSVHIVWLGAAGLLLMFLGVSHFLHVRFEVPLTMAGVTLVIVAHVLNFRARGVRRRP